MNDVSGNDIGSAQPVIIATVENASEYADFGYAEYTQMFWGGVLNGIVLGCLVALLSQVICKLFDVTRNVESKGE